MENLELEISKPADDLNSILDEFDKALSILESSNKKNKSRSLKDKSYLKNFKDANVFRKIGNEMIELNNDLESQKSISIIETTEPTIFEKASEHLSTLSSDFSLNQRVNITLNTLIDEPSFFEKASKYLSIVSDKLSSSQKINLTSNVLIDEPSIFEKASEYLSSIKKPLHANWHPSINIHIKSEIVKILKEFEIKSCSINYGPEPTIFKSNNEFFICLTPNALENIELCIPQLKSLLCKKNIGNKYNLPENLFWDYSKELEMDLPIYENVLAPSYTKSSKLFIDLIEKIKDNLHGKKVLEIGCGCGSLSVLMARYGASVVTVDISKEAIENTKLLISFESESIKSKITVGESDIYTNLEEITGLKNLQFDYVIFNNPLMKGFFQNDLDKTCFAGINFDTPIRAITSLSNVLKKNGEGYFLVANILEKDSPIKKFFGNSPVSEQYFNTTLLNNLIKYIKPNLDLTYTNFRYPVSSDPMIEYVISQITY